MIYVGSTLFQRSIPFLLLPLLTAYLEPHEYGTVAVFQAILAIIMPFLGSSLPISINREYHSATKQELAGLIGNLIVMSIAIAILVAGGIGCLGLFWGGVLGIPMGWLVMATLAAPFFISGHVYLTVLRFNHQPMRFATVEIVGVTINIGISVLLVVAVGLGWRGRAVGILAGPTAVGVLGLLLIVRGGYIGRGLSLGRMKQIFFMSLPVSMHLVSSAFMNGMDRLFVDVMVGKATVGMYAVASSFGAIVAMALQSFHQAWGPRMFKALSDPTAKNRMWLVRCTYLHDGAALLLAILVAGGSHLLIPLMTAEQYHESGQYVIWIAFGFSVNGMYSMRSYYLIHSGKTAFMGLLAVVVIVVNACANYVLIRANGAVGAAQATILAYTIRFVAVWWYAHRIHPMPWRLQ